MRTLLFCAALLSVTSPAAALAAQESPRIQIIGDSLMSIHMITGRAIPNWIGRLLGKPSIPTRPLAP